jgi:hypothetical protein
LGTEDVGDSGERVTERTQQHPRSLRAPGGERGS